MIVFGRYRFQPEGTTGTICESFAVERMPNTQYFLADSLRDMPMCMDLPREHWSMGITFTHGAENRLQAEFKAQMLEQMERALSGIKLVPAASPTPIK